MSLTWIPINNYPGDQLADLPNGFWAEIGQGNGPLWTWDILAADGQGCTSEVAGGVVSSEADAKAAVEAWEPRHANITHQPDTSTEAPWNIGLYEGETYIESRGAATHRGAIEEADAWVNYHAI